MKGRKRKGREQEDNLVVCLGEEWKKAKKNGKAEILHLKIGKANCNFI